MIALTGLKKILASHTDISSRMPPRGFPAIPSTLHAGDHEMHDWNAREEVRATTLPQYTPYLGLRSRLSQVWINRWTVLILLVICRLLLATASIKKDLANAKAEALAACTSVETVGSAMASMPHYMSQGVNAVAADGITSAVNGLMTMLSLTVTGVEELVLFYINMLTSTYVCLITLVVSGSLHAAIALLEDVAKFVNETIGTLTNDLSGGLSVFEKDLNGFLSAINIGGLFGSSKTPPSINLTEPIDKLNHITIDPTKFDAELTKLNASIPDFAQVHDFTNNVIKTPFELVKRLINESMASYTFDKSVFPVAQKQALNFCSENPGIDNFFNGLTKVVFDARLIFLIILSIAAVLACVPHVWLEIYRYGSMLLLTKIIQGHARDPVDVVYIASRPSTAKVGIRLAEKVRSEKKRILIRWLIAYCTTLPVLFVLALGITGLLASLFQWILLKAIAKEVPVLAQEVDQFADVVVGALNNASMAWAVGANIVTNSTQAKVNHDVFGWVNTTTSALNETLNTFSDEMTKALNATFGGTILYQPVTGLYECLIGLKIAAFEKVITWVQDHAHVTFPEFREDIFSLGAAASIAPNSSANSFLSSPGNSTSDGITGAVDKVTHALEKAIKQEALIAAALVGVWFVVFLMGLARVVWALCSRDKTRAEGGAVVYPDEDRAPTPGLSDRNGASTFPEFGGPPSAPYPTHHSEQHWSAAPDYAEDGDEKVMGAGGQRYVETHAAPEYQRSSAYGYLNDSKR